MTDKFTYFRKGIELRGETSDPSDNIEGSVFRNSTTNRIKAYIESAVREIVTNSQTQTLTNKTIDADQNTITNIENADIKTGAAIDATKIADGSVSNTEFQYLDGVTSAIQTQINSKQGTLTNSAGLAAALSDETGSGLAVFNDSPVLINPNANTIVGDEQGSTPSNPSSGKRKLYFKGDGKLYQLSSAGIESEVGAGNTSLGTVFQLIGTEAITDWASGDNATFLGGGTLSGTLAKETSSPLNGVSSYKYTQAAGSLDDYIASPVQSVPSKFRGQTAFLSFSYKYDGGNSDIQPIIYDVTNSAILSDTTLRLSLNSTIASTFMTSVVIPSSCTQVRVGFHVKTLNSGKILTFDDLQMSQDIAQSDQIVMTETVMYQGYTSKNGSNQVKLSTADNNNNNSKLLSVDNSGTFTKYIFLNKASYTTTSSTQDNNTQVSGSVGVGHYNSAGTLLQQSSGGVGPSGMGSSGITGIANAGDYLAMIVETLPVVANARLFFSVTASSSNPAILTPNDQFSTDTATLTYAGSGTYTDSTLVNAPVGTFITFTKAANSNATLTQTNGSAPTQTTSDMNTNGIRLYAKAYNEASLAATPSLILMQIGKNHVGVDVKCFGDTGKITGVSIDKRRGASGSVYLGADYCYSPSSGILTINTALDNNGTSTSGNRYVGEGPYQGGGYTDGYFVINASKTPALTAVPYVQPRIAYIKDVKANGTAGGTFTQNAWQTRTLNDLVDSGSLGVTLSSNQFTLQPGTYHILASAPAMRVNNHTAKLRNITDSSDTVIGTAEWADSSNNFVIRSVIKGSFTITSAKTFEIQHFCGSTKATDGFGLQSTAGISTGVSEVYTIVEIMKIR